MKLSFCSYMFKWYPLERAFEIAAECGFKSMELWGGRPHAFPYDMDCERIGYIKGLIDKTGVTVPVYSPEVLAYPFNICSRMEKERQETVLYLKRAIDAASDLQSGIMVLPIDHAGYLADRRRVMEELVVNLQILGDYAFERGVTVAVEPVTIMESNICCSLDNLLELLERVKSDAVKATVDLVPAAVHQESITDYIKELGDKIINIHLAESDLHGPHHYNIGETGTPPVKYILNKLEETDYKGNITIELLWPFMRDPELFAFDTARRIRNLNPNLLKQKNSN